MTVYKIAMLRFNLQTAVMEIGADKNEIVKLL